MELLPRLLGVPVTAKQQASKDALAVGTTGRDSSKICVHAEGASDMERRDLVLQGWDIDHKDIEIAKHEDGSDWLLGAGSYGKVCTTTPILRLTLTPPPA